MVSNSDNNVLDLRFVRCNTGLLKGMGHARGEVGRRRETSIRLGYDAHPDEVEVLDRGLRLGPDYVEETGDGWQVLFREGTELDGYRDLRMAVASSGLEVEPLLLDGWTTEVAEPLGAVSGALAAGGRHRFLVGRGVLLHRYGPNPPTLAGARRDAVFALAEDISVGVDQTGGDVVAWAWIDGELYQASPVLTRDEGTVMVDFRPDLPLMMRVQEHGPRVTEDPYEELSDPERIALDAWAGLPTRELTSGVAEIRWMDQALTAPALSLQVR